jgi:hypothetical protein
MRFVVWIGFFKGSWVKFNGLGEFKVNGGVYGIIRWYLGVIGSLNHLD